jgi:DeoR/GlpR family transcriptional regulator of sugar metabolism
MRASERRQLVLESVLAGQGNVHELSERFGVSASTVRRDLERLVADGRVARTYGGAVGSAGHHLRTLQERETSQAAEKDAIAARAAELVHPGESVILEAGSTIGRLAGILRGRAGLRLITNSVNTLATLADAEQHEVIFLGGRVRVLNQATSGSMTEANLRTLTADRAFLSGPAVHARFGLAAPLAANAYLKAVMAERAHELYVLADSSKLGLDTGDFWTPLDRPWTLVTDAGADSADIDEFSALPDVTVVIAELN